MSDSDLDRRLHAAAERWQHEADRDLARLDRSGLRSTGSPFAGGVARAIASGALVVALIAAVAVALPGNAGPQFAAIGSPSPNTSGPRATLPASPTSRPTALETPSPRFSPPSPAEQRRRAERAFAAWEAYVEGLHPETIQVLGELDNLDHGWRGRNGDEHKSAYHAGLFELLIDLPADVPEPAPVTWADGSMKTVSLVSAADAFAAIAPENPGSCVGCVPLEIVAVRLASRTFQTLEGPAEMPVWEFTIRQGNVHLYRVAAQHAVLGKVSPLTFAAVSGSTDIVLHVAGGACDEAEGYHGAAVEFDSVVAVFTWYEGSRSNGICTANIASYSVTVALDEPLGDRMVIDMAGNPLGQAR
jgi:hypothetical protein